MTVNEIKEELREIKKINNLIKCKLRQIEELDSLSQKITTGILDGMPKGTNNKDQTNIIDKKIMLEESLSKDVINLLNRKLLWKEYIDRLPIISRTILEEYYFNGKTWEQISYENNYSFRTVHYNHGKALKELEQNIKKENGR